MRKFLSLLFTLCCFNVYSQSSNDLDKLIYAVDSQTANVKLDTSKLRGWNSEMGSYEETIYAEFKIAKNNDLLRILVDKPGKERIFYYFNRGNLIGAKIEFSQEFKSWAGKSIGFQRSKPKEVIISFPDDESPEHVSHSLALSGYAWKRYYRKIK